MSTDDRRKVEFRRRRVLKGPGDETPRRETGGRSTGMVARSSDTQGLHRINLGRRTGRVKVWCEVHRPWVH